jgi:hypothetical protein
LETHCYIEEHGTRVSKPIFINILEYIATPPPPHTPLLTNITNHLPVKQREEGGFSGNHFVFVAEKLVKGWGQFPVPIIAKKDFNYF